jgi:hypothetical protein
MKLTVVGTMAVAAFVISVILLIYVLESERRKRDLGGSSPGPPPMR